MIRCCGLQAWQFDNEPKRTTARTSPEAQPALEDIQFTTLGVEFDYAALSAGGCNSLHIVLNHSNAFIADIYGMSFPTENDTIDHIRQLC